MSWLFPEAAIETELIELDCASLDIAMEGAFTEAFGKNISARREIKPHKKAMQDAVRQGNYSTAAKEADECARILREAVTEIKAVQPSMLSNIIVQFAMFAIIELMYIVGMKITEKNLNNSTNKKYAELDKKASTVNFNDHPADALRLMASPHYDEAAKLAQKLGKQAKMTAQERMQMSYSLTASKMVAEARDESLKKNKIAMKAAQTSSAVAVAICAIGDQMKRIKKAQDGKIAPGEVNALLKVCIDSLEKGVQTYTERARDFKSLARTFGGASECWLFDDDNSEAAQEGLFSTLKANYDAKHAHQKLVNHYAREIEKVLDGIDPYNEPGKFMKYFVQYCSNELVEKSKANAAMNKFLQNFDKADLNCNSPTMLKVDGYCFVRCLPADGDDSTLVFIPDTDSVDKINHNRFDEVGGEEIEMVYSGTMYDRICASYIQQKLAEGPAQEGLFDWFVASKTTTATESDIVASMGELEKAQAFVSAWLECHEERMEPLYGAEADEVLDLFRSKHVQDELNEDPDYVDPHEKRHCGRLTYLVEVKPDTTNVTIPVCWDNRNTTVEYGSKEIDESLVRYYDAAVQPQEEVIAEPAQEGAISNFYKLLTGIKGSQKPASIISKPDSSKQRTATVDAFKISMSNFIKCYKDAIPSIGVVPVFTKHKLISGTKGNEVLSTFSCPEGQTYTIDNVDGFYYGYTTYSDGGVVTLVLPVDNGTTFEYRADWITDDYETIYGTPKERAAIYDFAVKTAQKAFLPMQKVGAPYAINNNSDYYEDFVTMSGSEISIIGCDWGEFITNLPLESDENAMWKLLDSCSKELGKQFKASKYGKAFFAYADGDKFDWFVGISDMSRYAELKKYGCALESQTEPAQEAWSASHKVMNGYLNAVPKWAKDKKSARVKDINARTKANIQASPDRKRLFKAAAVAIRPQQGWKTGDAAKAQCEEMVARQMKKERVISAEIDNYGDLYYMVVHTKETGYDEWIMYIPQVAGVKTRNIHQAAREIALLQNAGKASHIPSLESQIIFG